MEKRIEESFQEEEIVIVGAGIAGLATALALERVGLKSRVLERHSELRATGGALLLFPNAWLALRAIGVDNKLASINPNHFPDGDLRRRKMLVQRKVLLTTLAQELPVDAIRFSSKLISIQKDIGSGSDNITILHLEDGTVIKAKVVIGCDGVHSMVARWLGLSRPINSGQGAFRGLSVFPEGHGFEQLREFFAPGMRAAYLSLNSTELHWFLLHRSSTLKKDVPSSPELILREVTENLAKYLPSEFRIVAENTDLTTLTWTPLLSRAPWNIAFGPAQNGTVTVAGDAMHPMLPDLGQGGCSALEDAFILARCLRRARDHGGQEWHEMGLKRYVEERRWRVTWQVAGSWFAGWVQRGAGGDGWCSMAVNWFRDHVYYKFVCPLILKYYFQFDSGDLIPSNQ